MQAVFLLSRFSGLVISTYEATAQDVGSLIILCISPTEENNLPKATKQSSITNILSTTKYFLAAFVFISA